MLTENLALTNSGAEATSFEVSEQPVFGAAGAYVQPAVSADKAANLAQLGQPNVRSEGAGTVTAPADIVLDQAPNQVNGFFADAGCDLCAGQQSIAENFALSDMASVGQIIFWTGYFPGDVPIDPDNITVLFHEDAAGLPGPVISTESNVSYTREQTGVILFGVHEYLHTLTLGSPVVLPAGNYWVEIFNDTGFGTDDFFWETGNIDPMHGLPGSAWTTTTPGDTWNYDGVNDLSIQLVPGGSLDVPWLSEDPVTGTLEADSFFDIAVTFDSMTYTVGTTLDAMLKVKTDDENSPIEIPVTMNVVAWEYGVESMLAEDALSGAPGETVTYTVYITNTGNVADVFDVDLSGSLPWSANAPETVGPLGPGEVAMVEIGVNIPADAQDGEQDVATCVFTSQGDPTKSDSATMITTADVPYEFGVDLAPATDAKAGTPGSMVMYVLQLTNTGDITDTFDLAVGSVEGWLVDLSAIEFTLGAGETAEVTVHVTVPAGAVQGDGDVTTVAATSQGDDSAVATSVLTTTVVFPKIFLPVIPQGFTTP
jgi:hypothetical protein